jgi:hypothetical protein
MLEMERDQSHTRIENVYNIIVNIITFWHFM